MKKVYVITGATSGIGNALVKAFADDALVFAGYRNENYERDLRKISSNVIPFYIDFEKKSSIRQATAYIKSKTDRIDTLINAAGCVIAGEMTVIDPDDVRRQFEVNTFSHLDFSQRLIPLMKHVIASEHQRSSWRSRGNPDSKIINISSMSSFGVFPYVAPYCASKRALDILFNSMLLEIPPCNGGLKIVSVKPGVIVTPLWEKSIELNKNKLRNGMEFLVENARKNAKNGLDVQKVVKLIKKIDALENPKASYTIGLDAKFAEILSKLPQDWVNFIVKKGINNSLKLNY
ncbi:MAG: SDR family NAD(P)-dependent oxidoreductase [Heliobacteriaceae bacterium]|jgi:NAD(P)-dependent dehydrogenase (short-subunit alcohol dehydrogenase family)|nr:SDR family NAD(P)-dependent oxidoreductase [Heliobacteriaceae bacterium]